MVRMVRMARGCCPWLGGKALEFMLRNLKRVFDR